MQGIPIIVEVGPIYSNSYMDTRYIKPSHMKKMRQIDTQDFTHIFTLDTLYMEN